MSGLLTRWALPRALPRVPALAPRMAQGAVPAVRHMHSSPVAHLLGKDMTPQRFHRAKADVAPEDDPHQPLYDQEGADQAQAILHETTAGSHRPAAPSPMTFDDGLEPGVFDDLGGPPADFGADVASGQAHPAVVDMPWEVYEVEPSLFDSKALRAPDTHPLINKMVGIMTKEGNRAKAEKVVSDVMLRLARATNDSPLPLFVEAIRRASPNVDTMSQKKGAKVIHTPRPLSESASAHRGIKAILRAAFRRSDKWYADRVAKELIAVVEGRSGVLQKRLEAHKHALANRANLSVRI